VSRQPHPLTLIAMACALFLRVWVPAGWMPAPAGGAFAIAPCTASAPAPLSHASSHHGSSHKNQHEGDCAFAPLQSALAKAEAPALVPVRSLPPIMLGENKTAPFFATGPPAPPPPATGPPTSA
jgi:hypothetical protein